MCGLRSQPYPDFSDLHPQPRGLSVHFSLFHLILPWAGTAKRWCKDKTDIHPPTHTHQYSQQWGCHEEKVVSRGIRCRGRMRVDGEQEGLCSEKWGQSAAGVLGPWVEGDSTGNGPEVLPEAKRVANREPEDGPHTCSQQKGLMLPTESKLDFTGLSLIPQPARWPLGSK